MFRIALLYTAFTAYRGVIVYIWSNTVMLPVKKTSKSRTRTRRNHKKLTATNFSSCVRCGNAKLPHAACDKCGYVNPKITLKLGKEEAS